MPRPKLYASDAERQAAYRARKGESLTVILPPDVMAGLKEKVKRAQMDRDPNITLSSYVADLIRTQVLRKR